MWLGGGFVKYTREFMKPTDNHDMCLYYKNNLKGNEENPSIQK